MYDASTGGTYGMNGRTLSRAGSAALLALILGSRLAAGQGVAELEARIQRLRQRQAELNGQAEAIAAADRARWIGSLDSLRVGSLRVLAPHDLGDVARRAAALAWRALNDRLGDSVAMLVHRMRFVLIPDAITDSARADLRKYATLGTVVLVPAVDRERQAALNIVIPVYQELWHRLDPALQGWLSAPLIPRLEPDVVTPGSYIELATSGSPVARSCYQGDLPACGEALGLSRPDDPALAWYSAEGRRALVARQSQVLRVGADREVFADCVGGRVDRDCLALLRSHPGLVPPPLSGSTRGGAFLSAIRTGGSGSLQRLLLGAADSTMAYRLHQAGGADVAALLAQWRTTLMATRPKATQIPPATAMTTVAWLMGLLLLTFRSSRWR